MSYAEKVRAYCGREIVEPARQKGEAEVAIRAGDVHKDLGYTNRLPLVCSALGSSIFEETYRVQRIAVEGPLNGANTVLRFSVP